MKKLMTVTGPNGSFSGYISIENEMEVIIANYGTVMLYHKKVDKPEKFLKIVEDAEYYLREHLSTLANQKINVPDLEKQLAERGYYK